MVRFDVFELRERGGVPSDVWTGEQEGEERTHVLVLEELGDSKEELGGLLGREGLSTVEQVDNPGEEGAAGAR